MGDNTCGSFEEGNKVDWKKRQDGFKENQATTERQIDEDECIWFMDGWGIYGVEF